MRKILFLVMVTSGGITICSADSKLTALSTDTTPSVTDVVYEVKNPASSPSSKQLQIGDLLSAGATFYIRNQSTLQSGSTFYVSSGTVSTLNIKTAIRWSDGTVQTSSPTAGGGAGINNQNTLQSGATAYPDFVYVGTSETVSGTLTANQVNSTGPFYVNGTFFAFADANNNYTVSNRNAGGPGLNNTIIGYTAGNPGSTGSNNVTIGSLAGAALTSASSSVFIGYTAGQAHQSNGNNVLIGFGAGKADTKGGGLTFIGYNAGTAFNDTGSHDNNDTAIGETSGLMMTTGTGNTFVGSASGTSDTTASNNTCVGFRGCYSQTGELTACLGRECLYQTTGNNNTSIGYRAGYSNTSGVQNTFLGDESDVSAGNLTNTTAIGYNTGSGQSNSMILGNGEDVGIGTGTPGAKVHIIDDSSSKIVVIVKAASSQSADLMQWDNSSGIRNMRILSNFVFSSTGTVPSLSTCGTGPTLIAGSTDEAGTVTAGSASGGCTITFAGTYASTPTCTVTPQAGSVVNTFSYSVGNTTIVTTETGFGTGKFDYICRFHEN